MIKLHDAGIAKAGGSDTLSLMMKTKLKTTTRSRKS
jgi:hypothetical protein